VYACSLEVQRTEGGLESLTPDFFVPVPNLQPIETRHAMLHKIVIAMAIIALLGSVCDAWAVAIRADLRRLVAFLSKGPLRLEATQMTIIAFSNALNPAQPPSIWVSEDMAASRTRIMACTPRSSADSARHQAVNGIHSGMLDGLRAR